MAVSLNQNMGGLFLSLLSSAILIITFPPFNLGVLAWTGLAPLFLAIRWRSPWIGFIFSGTCGIFFFLGLSTWILSISRYSIYHHALLIIYLGLYFGIFGLTFNFISLRRGFTYALYTAPFLWVSLEYTRSNMSFLSLPWALLGHTQYKYPDIIQVAALAGSYSISFLIVMVNAALAAIISVISPHSRVSRGFCTHLFFKKATLPLLSIAASITLLSLLYGNVITSRPLTGKRITISAIQGNIEQEKKWDPQYAQEIRNIYASLTNKASANRPDLILWPETATPGSIDRDPNLFGWLKEIAREAHTYIVLGSAQYRKFEKTDGNAFKYLNSAFLVSPNDTRSLFQQYDKIQLFPFGEYLPYRNVIPWNLINVSSINEYVAGKEYTVFEHPDFRFAVTICWENMFPALCREFVKRGAQFLVNITNEARFGKTPAPHQFLAISVFRAVENGVYIIRCANTGVSCIIDSHGRIVKRLYNEEGQDLFVRGILQGTIIPMESKTLYLCKGYLFPILSIAVALIFLFIAWLKPCAHRESTCAVKNQ